MKKIITFIRGHKIVSLIVLIVVVCGGYFGYQKINAQENSVSYTTAKAEKGMLISSISGTGQVSASNQVDIKPKVSGNLAALHVTKGQDVETKQLIAAIDARAAGRAVDEAEIALEQAKIELEELLAPPDVKLKISEAEIALEQAKIELEELLAPPDAQTILQARNALAQAERDFDKAKSDYESIEDDAERTLTEAYEGGYASVSDTFFKLSDYMADLKDVLGTQQMSEAHITAYELILGPDSVFTEKLLDDYDDALDKYNKNFSFFRGTYSDAGRETIYKLIKETLETTKAITQALESARHMYDAIETNGYSSGLIIASHINEMQPKVESDLAGIFSAVNVLQNTMDIIDDTVQNTPDEIKDAELAMKSAEENLASKQLALEELEAGADFLDIRTQQNVVQERQTALEELKIGPSSLDVRTQQNIVAQRETALVSAGAELADHYIYAPFDGIVAEINSDLRTGDSVSSGTILASIMTKQKIAEVTLNEIDVAQVKIEQRATLQFDAASDLSITGKVVEIDTLGTVNQGVVSYGIKIAFDVGDERIKPGMTVSTSIILESKQNILLVPLSAVKGMGNSSYVEVLVNGQPQRKTVVTGSSSDMMIEIVQGLEEGEEIITQTIPNNSSSSNSSGPSGQTGRNSGMGGMMRMMR